MSTWSEIIETGPGKPDAPEVAEAGQALKQEVLYGGAFLRAHGWRLLLVFAGILLPLWGFGALVEDLHEGEVFAFDLPVLQMVHSIASPGFDRAFVLISAAGYGYGVVPFDAALVLALGFRRRFREGLFAGIAVGGSALLNLSAKFAFGRVRPSLWDSIAPETTFSFPSGHAMGSMTLAWVLVLLSWNTRWRWPVTLAAVVFTVLVGVARIYLGVHYPSDILAGWSAASVWVVGVYGLVFYGSLRPWQKRNLAPGA